MPPVPAHGTQEPDLNRLEMTPHLLSSLLMGVIIIVLLVGPFIEGLFTESIIAPELVVLVGMFTGLTTVFLNKSLAVISITYITMMTMSVPVINAVLGYTFLDETLTLVQIIGAITILIAGYFANKLRIG